MELCGMCHQPTEVITVARMKGCGLPKLAGEVELCTPCLDSFESMFKAEVKVPDTPGKYTWIERNI